VSSAERMTIERREPIRLRTTIGVAILLHLLLLLSADRFRLLANLLPVPQPPPKEEPLKFVFTEAPKSEEPPPEETKRVAAERQRAQSLEPPDQTPPSGRAAKAVTAQPPAPRDTPRPTPRPQPTPQPQQQPTPLPRPTIRSRLTEDPALARPTPTPAKRLFSESAIAQAVQSELPRLAPQPAKAIPRGVMAFDAKDFEWGPYAQRIYRIIERNWHKMLRTTVVPGLSGASQLRFRIDRNGRISQLELLAEAGWVALDQAALASIQMSNPLPNLPAAYPHKDVGLTLGYYYNVPLPDGD